MYTDMRGVGFGRNVSVGYFYVSGHFLIPSFRWDYAKMTAAGKLGHLEVVETQIVH